MEILSDATFKGEVRVDSLLFANGGLRLENGVGTETEFFVEGGAWFNASCVYIRGSVDFNGTSIGSWAGLNSILNFAPKSLSTTVSSLSSTVNTHTTNITCLFTAVNSNITKINTLCTKVANVPNFCSVTLDFDVPADCTKFIISTHSAMNSYYMFMTKGTNPRSPVNIDLEARCDSTTGSSWVFVATKSSGLAMCAVDKYTLGYFYK